MWTMNKLPKMTSQIWKLNKIFLNNTHTYTHTLNFSKLVERNSDTGKLDSSDHFSSLKQLINVDIMLSYVWIHRKYNKKVMNYEVKIQKKINTQSNQSTLESSFPYGCLYFQNKELTEKLSRDLNRHIRLDGKKFKPRTCQVGKDWQISDAWE